MNEKEKMLSGELYNPLQKDLLESRERAKNICYEYNQIHPQNIEEKFIILKGTQKCLTAAWEVLLPLSPPIWTNL